MPNKSRIAYYVGLLVMAAVVAGVARVAAVYLAGPGHSASGLSQPDLVASGVAAASAREVVGNLVADVVTGGGVAWLGDASNHAGAVSATRDARWLQYPRTEFSLGWYLTFLPDTIIASSLVRNKHLNPGDLVLPPEAVKELDVALTEVVAPKLRGFNEAQLNIALRDMELLDASIAWRPAKSVQQIVAVSGKAELIEFFPMGGSGPTEVYKTTASGEVVCARQVDLPGLVVAKEARAFLITEMGCGLVKWFESAGVCPSGSAEAVRADVFAWAETVKR